MMQSRLNPRLVPWVFCRRQKGDHAHARPFGCEMGAQFRLVRFFPRPPFISYGRILRPGWKSWPFVGEPSPCTTRVKRRLAYAPARKFSHHFVPSPSVGTSRLGVRASRGSYGFHDGSKMVRKYRRVRPEIQTGAVVRRNCPQNECQRLCPPHNSSRS
jgi:hypothetical protein